MRPKPVDARKRPLAEPAFGDVLQSLLDGFVQDVLEKAEGAAMEAALEGKRRLEREFVEVAKRFKIGTPKAEE